MARDAEQENRPVIIKKYANRRLYNTDTSTYVTLEDLAEMVRGERDFVVYDAKTGEDLTHAVLPTSMPLEDLYRELAKLQTLAGARGILSMYRHWPLRDSLRASFVGWSAVRALGRAARDHGAGPGTTEWRAPTVASAT